MKSKQYPSQSDLQKLFTYHDGELLWRDLKWKNKKSAGWDNGKGRHKVQIGKDYYYRSILVWIYHYGDFDSALQVDHINRVKSDDRIENLRLLTINDNVRNKDARSNTGIMCVSYDSKHNRYSVTVDRYPNDDTHWTEKKRMSKSFRRLKHAVEFRNKIWSERNIRHLYGSDILDA